MIIFKEAVKIAEEKNDWENHPNKNRENQVISFVPEVGRFWQSNNPDEDVELNACVVYDKEENEYYVFVTTADIVTGKQIIETYELRSDIEEDFRQIKDFWKLDAFTTTKFDHITFHMVMTLLGYLFYQIYKNT